MELPQALELVALEGPELLQALELRHLVHLVPALVLALERPRPAGILSGMIETTAMPISTAARAIAKIRWSRATYSDRAAAAAAMARGRRKLSRAQRRAIASRAASAISPDAARARALKAWQTRRARQHAAAELRNG